jgi:hypothetical protein
LVHSFNHFLRKKSTAIFPNRDLDMHAIASTPPILAFPALSPARLWYFPQPDYLGFAKADFQKWRSL